jgi:hypothetical protein
VLRRFLPVLAVAAALVSIPGAALAAPGPAPVYSSVQQAFYAGIQVTVDGRPGSASLSRTGQPGHWQSQLFVSLPADPSCGPWWCAPTWFAGSVQLTDDQIQIGRDLKRAVSVEVPVTLTRSTYDPETGPAAEEKTVTVSLTINGTGALVHDAYHGNFCGEGWPCHGTRIDSFREGTGVLTVDGAALDGVGAVLHGLAVDAAVKQAYGTGDAGAPSNGSGD